MPQSNQRGIETRCIPDITSPIVSSLNRTSVGLKRVNPEETHNPTISASIEPAWD